jgi:hypothetical protein
MKFLIVHDEVTDGQRVDCRKFGLHDTAPASFELLAALLRDKTKLLGDIGANQVDRRPMTLAGRVWQMRLGVIGCCWPAYLLRS